MRIKFIFPFIITIFLVSVAQAKPDLNIERWQTGTNTPIYFVRAPQIPMADILVAFHAGSNRDGKQFGLANLTGSLLGEATQTLTADQIADKLDNLGMVFDVKTNRDMTVVHMRSLTEKKYFNPSLQLFIQLLAKATFPEHVFKRLQNNTLQDIAEQQQDPGTVANNEFANVIFSGSSYAHPISGDIKTIQSLTKTNAENFYKKYYVAKNAVIVIVGDLTSLQAKAVGRQVANALPQGNQAPQLPLLPNNNSTSLHVSFPADQTTIRMGEVSILPKDSINPSLIVGNYILGSGLTSLLFQTVRNEYGLTYGIGSYFVPLANRGAFVVALQTKNQQTNKAIEITQRVIHDYLKTGPSSDELQAAKDYLIGSFPLTIESNADIANFVLSTAFYNLPLDYIDHYTKNIKAVTSETVKKTMANYIHPNNFAIITVGGKS